MSKPKCKIIDDYALGRIKVDGIEIRLSCTPKAVGHFTKIYTQLGYDVEVINNKLIKFEDWQRKEEKLIVQ